MNSAEHASAERSPSRFDVVVIGAGQAGLAMGYFLARQGRRFVAPGLYFLGLTWQHTRGSALLGWVKDDAGFVAERIDAFEQARLGAADEAREDDVVGAPQQALAQEA